MKKIFLSLWLCVITMSMSVAQDSLKVGAKRWTTELNINPFKGELSLNNALNQIKFRYFTSNNTALRLGLSLNSRRLVSEVNDPYGTNPISSKEISKTRTVGVNLGFEKHLRGTSRLSPYLGAELSLVSKRSKQSIKGPNYESEVDGAWRAYGNQGDNFVERGFFAYGVNLITGFDFYIVKNLYLGYELNLGLSKIIYKDIDVKTRNGGVTSPRSTADYNETEFFLGANLMNGIRIGYAF